MLGELVKTIREDRGWTVRDLAHEAGVGTATISRLENHNQITWLPTVEAIAAAFDTSAGQLLLDADKANGKRRRRR